MFEDIQNVINRIDGGTGIGIYENGVIEVCTINNKVIEALENEGFEINKTDKLFTYTIKQ